MNAFEIRWDILQHASHALRNEWQAQNEVNRNNAQIAYTNQSSNRAACGQYELAKPPTFEEIRELAGKMYDFVQGEQSGNKN